MGRRRGIDENLDRFAPEGVLLALARPHGQPLIGGDCHEEFDDIRAYEVRFRGVRSDEIGRPLRRDGIRQPHAKDLGLEFRPFRIREVRVPEDLLDVPAEAAQELRLALLLHGDRDFPAKFGRVCRDRSSSQFRFGMSKGRAERCNGHIS